MRIGAEIFFLRPRNMSVVSASRAPRMSPGKSPATKDLAEKEGGEEGHVGRVPSALLLLLAEAREVVVGDDDDDAAADDDGGVEVDSAGEEEVGLVDSDGLVDSSRFCFEHWPF